MVHRRRNRGGGVGWGGEGRGDLAPIMGMMCIKYAEFILHTPFGPLQSCLRSYASNGADATEKTYKRCSHPKPSTYNDAQQFSHDGTPTLGQN